ncbi:MAG: radical SAM protein [Candidatus Diapherotrites archaeon]|nr:radical SAM protein [Candidatus Diapherotrites archaeon]
MILFLIVFLPVVCMSVKRFDIKLGFKCNNNCLCCPAADKKFLGDQDLASIKQEITLGFNEGSREVVLTGGEPTVRNDLLEIVEFCKSTGFEFIQLQTNGRMFSYEGFCKKLIEAGVNEFGPSLHGPNAKIHDYFTQSPGAFDQVVQGIKNLKELNQRVIINSVITKFNYRLLPETARLFVSLGVDQYQFVFPHLVGNAWKNADLICPKKSEVEPFLKGGLEVGINAGIQVMVEAYPFCFLKGFEVCSSDLYMPPADTADATGIRKDHHLLRRETGKVKHAKCKKCRFGLLCEGPWKEYIAKFDWDEFRPVSGKKIKSKEELFETFGKTKVK